MREAPKKYATPLCAPDRDALVRRVSCFRATAAILDGLLSTFAISANSLHQFYTMFSGLLQLIDRLVHRQILHFERVEEIIRLCPIVCIISQNPLRGGKNLR